MPEAVKVFVYGTLKPGETNYQRYCRGHVIAAEEAVAVGQLYDLPFGYPAMTLGDSLVYGFVLSFSADMLPVLDELEDYSPLRPLAENEYIRVEIEVFNLNRQSLGQAWVYLMEQTLIDQAKGVLLPEGKWSSY